MLFAPSWLVTTGQQVLSDALCRLKSACVELVGLLLIFLIARRPSERSCTPDCVPRHLLQYVC